MSYLAKLEASRKELIYWVAGKEHGFSCWFYVKVEKPKLELFKARLKSDHMELKDYGTILYSGWGKTPPEDIRRKLHEEFG